MGRWEAVDQKQGFEDEARSGCNSPLHRRPSRGLHCCRRHWVGRLSEELLLHLSSCKLRLHDHLHLHPCHHWHLPVGFANNNEDMRGMLRSSIGNINSNHLPDNGHYQCNHQPHHPPWIKNLLYLYFYQCRICRIHKNETSYETQLPKELSSELMWFAATTFLSLCK